MFGLWLGRKPSSILYTPVEDQQRLLSEQSQPSEPYQKSRKRPWRQWGMVLLHLTTFCAATMTGVFLGYRWLSNPDTVCTQHMSQYCKRQCERRIVSTAANFSLAPILTNLEIKYDVVRFNGSLLKENVFRLGAGAEVDAAWESLGVNCEPSLRTARP
jgi:hypothetical protein